MARRAQLGDENVLPDAMQAERHQIVHQIVAVRDLVKDVVDEALLLVEANGSFAEMRMGGGVDIKRLQNRAHHSPAERAKPNDRAEAREGRAEQTRAHAAGRARKIRRLFNESGASRRRRANDRASSATRRINASLSAP